MSFIEILLYLLFGLLILSELITSFIGFFVMRNYRQLREIKSILQKKKDHIQ